MMKKITLLCFLLISIVLINDDDIVECRPEPRRRHRKDDFMVFVFGDSFVDAGNRPPTTEWSRQWFQPYGVSDSLHHHRATGRMSDGLVQSDFLARMLGQDESPPAYRLGRQSNDDEVVDASGVNFAMSGSAVVSQGEGGPPSLDDQIDELSRLVRHGIIDREADLEDSVALIAFSGVKDYSALYVGATHDEIMALAGNLIDKMSDGVKQLQDLGVSKVLVNSMPPIGCQPYQTWMSNYAQCDAQVNTISNLHNAALKKKLDGMEDVLVLDLDSTFTHLIQSAGFEGTYKPCCDGTSKPEGYCGEEDAQGKAQYSVCTNPEDFFYWDYVHPTQAGWEAVMDRLQQPILDFLGIYD